VRERDFGEATSDAIDEEVRAIVEAAFRRTVDILQSRREALERGARLLLERETLDEKELVELLKDAPSTLQATGPRQPSAA
jgi:cell division protease FtsH